MTIAPFTPAATLLFLLSGTSLASEPGSVAQTPVLPPVITAPTSNSTVIGADVLFEGTAQPGAVVTVKDERGATVCAATADSKGAWACDGTQDPGAHQVTATAVFDGRASVPSGPVGYQVLEDELQTGGGCSASGQGPIALALLALAWFSARSRRSESRCC